MRPKHFYEFGPFRLEVGRRRLLRHDGLVPLTPKVFEILLALVERSPQVVEKEELIRTVWPDTFVEESNLTQGIYVLRKVLGEGAGETEYIETIPRRGYRFVAAVREVQVEDRRADGRSRPRFRRTWLAAALCVLAVACAVYLLYFRGAAIPKIQSLAVLPLENLSGDPEQEYFVDGLSEALTGDIAKIKSLRVISRTSAMHYKGARKRLPEIASELKVDAVVEGSVVKVGERVQIRVQLVHAPTDRHLWAETYNQDLRDILAVQNDVARAIAREIRIQLSPVEKARMASGRPVQRNAFEAHLRGRHYWNKRTDQSIQQAMAWFQTAIDADAAYAPPYAGLADCYNQLGTVGIGSQSPREIRPLALAAAKKALEIDPDLAEAHAALAYARMFAWDWAGAALEYRRAVELNPSDASARLWYSMYLAYTEQFEEAIRQVSQAQELDPLSLIVQTQVGWILKFADREDEAIRQYRQVFRMNPNYPWLLWQLGQSYTNTARYQEAIEVLEKGVRVSGRNPGVLGSLGEAYARAGRRADAQALLNELAGLSRVRYVTPIAPAFIYLGLGDNARFFECLERAFEEHSYALAGLRVWPSRRAYAGVRSEPRFLDLLRRVGL